MSLLTQSPTKLVKLKRSLTIFSLASASIFAAAGPARAAFQVFIDPSYGSTESTGVTGTLTFANFTGAAGVYSFDLSLTNTTPKPPFTASTFVGTAFNLPTGVTASLAGYDPGDSDFYELFLPASLNLGGGAELYSVGIRSGTPPAALQSPPSQFNGGNPSGGVIIGDTKTVSFTVNATAGSGLSDVGLFETAFSSLLRGSGLQSVGRFQQVTCTSPDCSVIVRGGSDKVGGGPDGPGPGPGPGPGGESVPGPLPLLGIGAAYSYSRKLRHRIGKTKTVSQSVAVH